MAVLRRELAASLILHRVRIWFEFISALVRGCPNRFICFCLAALTRSRTAELDSAFSLEVSFSSFTGGISTWISIRSRIGPESRFR